MATQTPLIEIASYGRGRRTILVDVADLDAVLTTMLRAGYLNPRDTGLRSGYGAGATAVVVWEPRRGVLPLDHIFDVGVA